MTKAQQVRARRLEKIDEILENEVEEIFDWILDSMDSDTKNRRLCACKLFLIRGRDEIINGNSTYLLSVRLLMNEIELLFAKLAELINKEDGFNAILKVDDMVYGEKAITLVVSIY